jgi:hypothetical protein
MLLSTNGEQSQFLGLSLPTGWATSCPVGSSAWTFPFNALACCWHGARSSGVRAVPHAKAQLLHLVLSAPTVRRKPNESAMDSAMNNVRGRLIGNGSAASCKGESHEGRSHASSTFLMAGMICLAIRSKWVMMASCGIPGGCDQKHNSVRGTFFCSP